MSSLDFPLNPVDGQEYSLNGVTYYYNASLGAWLTKTSTVPASTSVNKQVTFNDSGFSNGSYGLVFDKSANTLFANTINVSSNMRVFGNLQIGTGTVTITNNSISAASIIVDGSAIPSGAAANLAFDTANAAYAAANNVGPQIAPAFNTANAAYGAANNVGPQIAPAFNTANLAFNTTNVAFGKANTALQNTSGISFNGNFFVPSGNVGIGTASPAYSLDLNGKTDGFRLPSGTTAQRPSGANGVMRHNTTTGYIEYYDGSASAWIGIGAFSASGGTETTYTVGGTDYKSYTFTSSGSFTVLSGTKQVDVLLVAGGGGGGPRGGGGGAGGMLTSTYTVVPGVYSIVIGAGGSQSSDSSSGGSSYSGSNSTGFGLTAIGGGAGGLFASSGTAGGSGGGTGRDSGGSGGAGTSGQGNNGGSSPGPNSCEGGGGGGGKGGVGGDSTAGSGNERGGQGGTAATNDYRTGSNIYYAGGGGGGSSCNAGDAANYGLGGGTSTTANKGGGGDGSLSSTSRYPGAGGTNTGGGGGGGGDGAGYGGGGYTGAPGGSGIVVIRHPI